MELFGSRRSEPTLPKFFRAPEPTGRFPLFSSKSASAGRAGPAPPETPFGYARRVLRFDPNRTPVEPKDAATVVVVRAGERSVELFCVKRHARSGFLGGAVVFPGGKLAAEDHAPDWAKLVTPLGDRARAAADAEPHARAFAIAALRELAEEAAIVAVAGRELDDAAAREFRAELVARGKALSDESRALRELLLAQGLLLDARRLEAISRWITPEAEERRYDTRFYLLAVPSGQHGRHDEYETTSSFWASPTELFRLWENGDIFLAPPTIDTIRLFVGARSIDDAHRIARAQPLEPLCPHFVMDGPTAMLTLPGDPLYPRVLSARSDPAAPTRYVMRDGRFIPERA